MRDDRQDEAIRGGTVRIAAVADLHYARDAAQRVPLRDLFAQASRACDVLLLPGDLTDRGLPDEAQGLAREIHAAVGVPVVAVLGNHDFESSQPEEVRRILVESGIKVLDGEAVEVEGIGFAGVKGFCGGFGKRALGPWGEEIIKQFVHAAVEEALKLESALARLRRMRRVVVLHYSPIQETVEGEPCEIFPFLGSSRLAEPLGRYRVDAVFHGHAHRGAEEGRTVAGAPVYNVGLPVLRRLHPERPPFKLVEIPRHLPGDGGEPAPRPEPAGPL
ncbi:MAG TPA: metallophosphoesterase [Thermoanaerobaculia bacterium]